MSYKTTIVTPPELKDYRLEDIEDVMTRWTPNFAQHMDRGAGDLIGNLEDIQKHELWMRLGYSSMEDYLLHQLNHTQEWCDDVIRIYRREWNDPRCVSGFVPVFQRKF